MKIEIRFTANADVELSDVVRTQESAGSRWVLSANSVRDEFGTCAPDISSAMLSRAVESLSATQWTPDRVESAVETVAASIPESALGWMTVCHIESHRVCAWWVGGDVVYVDTNSFTIPHSAVREGAAYGSPPARLLTASLSAKSVPQVDSAQFSRRPDTPVLLLSHSISARVPPKEWKSVAPGQAEDGQTLTLGKSAFGFAMSISNGSSR